MTQAFNLSQFANNLNTSGATSNSGLQNSAVTVTAGTGMSGGGSVALGSSVTLTNAGVTSLVAGTGISISGSTGAVTVTNSSSASGTVTSVATGNGLSGGTITTTGTLAVACPSYNSVGSYALVACTSFTNSYSAGTNLSGGTGNNQLQVSSLRTGCGGVLSIGINQGAVSGTWKIMFVVDNPLGASMGGVACRVS
jgi:hypothetical protein